MVLATATSASTLATTSIANIEHENPLLFPAVKRDRESEKERPKKTRQTHDVTATEEANMCVGEAKWTVV